MNNSEKMMVCEECGRMDALRIGDRIICLECYEQAGSCCQEFKANDLWEAREESVSATKKDRL